MFNYIYSICRFIDGFPSKCTLGAVVKQNIQFNGFCHERAIKCLTYTTRSYASIRACIFDFFYFIHIYSYIRVVMLIYGKSE